MLRHSRFGVSVKGPAANDHELQFIEIASSINSLKSSGRLIDRCHHLEEVRQPLRWRPLGIIFSARAVSILMGVEDANDFIDATEAS